MIEIEHKQIIQELCEKICTGNLKYKNTVIIGENSTGKTTLLRTINKSFIGSLFIDCPFNKNLFNTICNNTTTVLIDNLETILSYQEILNIDKSINKKLRNKNFVLSTHNLELVAQLRDFNLIYITSDSYCIFDGNDFNSFNDVKNIISLNKSSNDIILVNLLNLKINKLWTDVEENRLNKLKNEPLSKTQELLLNQLKQY